MTKIETAEGALGHDCSEDCHLLDLISNGKYKEVLKKRFPHAKIKDAPGRYFPERFSIEFDVNEEEYYEFLAKEGIADYSLGSLYREIAKSPANEKILESLITEIEDDLQ